MITSRRLYDIAFGVAVIVILFGAWLVWEKYLLMVSQRSEIAKYSYLTNGELSNDRIILYEQQYKKRLAEIHAKLKINANNSTRKENSYYLYLSEKMQTPDFQNALKAVKAIDIHTRYGALFASLNLNSDQVERLRALLVNRMTRLSS